MGSIRFTIPMSLYKFVFVCLILHIEAKDLVVNKAARMMLYCIGHRPALPHPLERIQHLNTEFWTEVKKGTLSTI